MNTINYLQSYYNYFWQWEEDGEVIGVPESKTVAYSKFVFEILEVLSIQGLPPFGSLLLTIIATNPDGEELIKIIEDRLLSQSSSIEDNTIEEVIRFLKVLNQLPDQYKKGKRRIQIFQTLFEGCHNISSLKNSYLILKEKKIPLSSQELTEEKIYFDLKPLRILSSKYKSTNKLLSKLVNLPILEKEVLIDETISDSPVDLIELLSKENKTYKIGNLVKEIWSGLKIPFFSISNNQTPIGGISDISNKGNLDQLLISEHANDDLTFLSRLANNEALYINREKEQESIDQKRIILIDISIKNWGVPKIMAFSIMLAIAEHPKSNFDCEVFLIGDQVYPIKYNTIDAIIDALQILNPCLDSSLGLEHFFNKYRDRLSSEIFILTASSQLSQLVNSPVFNENKGTINHLIFSNYLGGIDVYKNKKKSRKHQQYLVLDLKRLWDKIPKSKDKTRKSDFEADVPILIRPSTKSFGVRQTADGRVFQITKNKALIQLHDSSNDNFSKGWKIICENIPISINEYEIGILDNGDLIVLTFRTDIRQILLFNIKTKKETKVNFNDWKNSKEQSFIFHDNKFFHYNDRGFWSINEIGEVEVVSENESNLRLEFKNKRIKLEEVNQKFVSYSNLYKNLNSVKINTANNLMFNVHELIINSNNQFKLKTQDSFKLTKSKLTAEKIGDDIFEFEDGSIVEMNRSGYMKLTSSNLNISTIYIPSVLNTTIGLSTKSEFSGATYFHDEMLFQLNLIDSGSQKIPLIKQIKNVLEIGLQEANEIINSAPIIIQKRMDKETAEFTKEIFSKNGAILKIIPIESQSNIELIEPQIFFNQYIKKYVKNILEYGA